MPKTILPKHHLIFITTPDGDPIVARFVQVGREMYSIERATNAAELAPAAREAVAADGPSIAYWYECPADLAARAEFGSES